MHQFGSIPLRTRLSIVAIFALIPISGMTGDWKVSELESVRIHFLPILEEIGKCQNRKVSELESVRIFRFFKYQANDAL